MILRVTLFLLCCSIGAMAQKPSPKHKATMAEQKTCAEQAAKYFHDNVQNPPPGIQYWHTSHYDPDAGVCYVRLEWAEGIGKPKEYRHSTMISDAFEGTLFAMISVPVVENSKHYPCMVAPKGAKAIMCESEDEFNDLVHRYFNLDN